MIGKLQRREARCAGRCSGRLHSCRDRQRSAGAEEGGLTCRNKNWLQFAEPVLFYFTCDFLLAIPERACYIGSMMTLLSHVDPAINQNRWYLVSVQATLFHPCSVVVAWGRRDNDFQQWRVIPLESMALAKLVAEKIVERKIKRGYQACTREQQ